MAKVGRPPKYKSEKERKEAFAKAARERYLERMGSVRPYKKGGFKEYTKTFWWIKYHALKTRSKKIGLPFDLTPQYLESIWTENCPIFKTKLEIGKGPNSPSIDRFVPELGYVQGNVCWISNRANTIKNDSTLQEIEQLYEWMKSKT